MTPPPVAALSAQHDWRTALRRAGAADVAKVVEALLQTTHEQEAEELAMSLEVSCMDGNRVRPIGLPLVAALMAAVPRAPVETRRRMVEAIALIASREAAPGDETRERCLRLVAGAFALWAELLPKATSEHELDTFVDVIGLCPHGDPALCGPVLASLRQVLETADPVVLGDVASSMLVTTMTGLEQERPTLEALAAARERLVRLEEKLSG